MTDQYGQPDINLGRNFFFNEVQVGDLEIQLTPETQLATIDTGNAPQTVRLPFARAAGPNALITIVLNNVLNSLTIATSAGDSFVATPGFVNPVVLDSSATTFRSNGADNWIVVGQTT